MISKQVILGSSLLIGGVVAMFAMTQNDDTAKPSTKTQLVAKETEVARPVAVPLTADMATEEKLLAQKQKEREAYNQQMSQEADQLLSEQERAKMLALDKNTQEASELEQERKARQAAQSEQIAAPAVQTRPEAIEAARLAKEKQIEQAEREKQKAQEEAKQLAAKSEKPVVQKPQVKEESQTKQVAQKSVQPAAQTAPAKAGEHKVVAGDTLIKLSHKYGVPVSVLAAANNMSRNDALPKGRTLKIPSAAQAAQIQRENQAKATKAQAQTTQTTQATQSTQAKPQATDKEKKSSNSGYSYSVQVALSPDKAKVDEMVKKYRAAGYQVSTSQTSRGTRVLIGSANSYDEANAIKQKLAGDSRVDANGAWVKKMEK